MESELSSAIAVALAEQGISDVEPSLEHPAELSHGDYATNVALVAAKQAGVSPRALAEALVQKLEAAHIAGVETIEIAGPGFINFRLSRKFFSDSVAAILEAGPQWGNNNTLSGQKIMVEYAQPNPFKPFHIGHLMSTTIGESISRLVQFSGAEIRRANYQGDVGLHVAKALWGLQKKELDPTNVAHLGEAYVYGNTEYEENETAKAEIVDINKKVYADDPSVKDAYQKGREASLAHFEVLYKKLGTKFDFYFFESETWRLGKNIVEWALQEGIFERSDGAVVFKAEKYGLHTRVFLTKEGLPPYEAKDLGLAQLKYEAFPFDISITDTAVEQDQYFEVVIRAIDLLLPSLSGKVRHVNHGMMQLTSGKMSSRKGNIVTGESLLYALEGMVRDRVRERGFEREQAEKISEQVAVAAIKYLVLKQQLGKNIVFDAQKAVSFEGDSGPYLQYAHTRARSVLEKASTVGVAADASAPQEAATELERLLYRFPEVVLHAAREYEPHYVTTYLIELSGVFNSWYAKERIADAGEYAPYRVALTQAFAQTMQNGLWTLGIPLPEKM